jgi:hypothetical protein
MMDDWKNLNPEPKGLTAIAHRMFGWLGVMFFAFDQLFACWFRGFVYVWFNGEKPSPDETLSSWVGRGALAGGRGFRIAEKLIDFFLGKGHCRTAIGK